MIMPYNTEHGDPAPEFSVAHYRNRLNRWAILRLLPDQTTTIVARFRSRSDADGHLAMLRRQMPEEKFMIVVDRQNESN